MYLANYPSLGSPTVFTDEPISGDSSKLPLEKRERVQAIFQRYLDRCATMWTSDEVLAVYTKSYGPDLTDAELAQMLDYYRSPVGVKDVAATRAANRALVATMSTEGKRRLQELLKDFSFELRTELTK